MIHAASNATAPQPRFTKGDNQSLPVNMIPNACNSSELAGKNTVTGSESM